jgi:hypothetical protein
MRLFDLPYGAIVAASLVLSVAALTLYLALHTFAFAWLNRTVWWIALFSGITRVTSSGNFSYVMVLALAPMSIGDYDDPGVAPWWFTASVVGWMVLYPVGWMALCIAARQGWSGAGIAAVRFTAMLAVGRLAMYEGIDEMRGRSWTEALRVMCTQKARVSIVLCYTVALSGCVVLMSDVPRILHRRLLVQRRRILDVD